MYLIWFLFISISPAIALFCYFYEQERNQRYSLAAKVELFLLGLTTTIPAFIVEGILDIWLASGRYSNYINSSIIDESHIAIPWQDALFMGFIWSATVEESIKLIYIFFWSRKFKRFKSAKEAIIYTVFLSLGFACLENIMYVFSYHQHGSILGLATGRAFMALPMHLLAAVAMGFWLWQYKISSYKNNQFFLLKALGAAILIHGTYNTLNFFDNLLCSLLVIILVIVGIYSASQLIINIDREREFELSSNSSITKKLVFLLTQKSSIRLITRLLTVFGIVTLFSSYTIFKILDGEEPSEDRLQYSSQSQSSTTTAQQYMNELESAEKTIRLQPNNYEAWYKKGKALTNLERYQEALIAYYRAIKIKPKYAEAWTGRSFAFRRLKQMEEALMAANQAININPKLAEAWKDKCGVFLESDRNREALVACEKAVQLKPDFPQAWYNRGIVLTSLKQYEEALNSYNKAIQFKPDYYKAWHKKGEVLGILQRFTEAITCFERAIQIQPDDYEIWISRGDALAAMQQYQEAMDSYKRADKIAPEAQAINSAIILKRKWKRYYRANPVTKKQLEQASAWYYQSTFLPSYSEEQIISLDKALQYDPNDYDIWNKRGHSLAKLQKYEEAMRSYDRALDINPDFGWAWYNRGLLLEDLERYGEALASYDKAIANGSFPAVEKAKQDLLTRLGR